MWIASTWNSYRSVRLLIHEAIIRTTVKYGTDDEKCRLRSSAKILKDMADGVCRSVPYFLNARPNNSQESTATTGQYIATPGGYLLMWPLFLSGMLRTTLRSQRQWIASTLCDFGLRMGLQLAISMAAILEKHAKSFSDSEVWFIGEFYP